MEQKKNHVADPSEAIRAITILTGMSLSDIRELILENESNDLKTEVVCLPLHGATVFGARIVMSSNLHEAKTTAVKRNELTD